MLNQFSRTQLLLGEEAMDKLKDPLIIGYIIKRNHMLSDFGKKYVSELEKYKQISK